MTISREPSPERASGEQAGAQASRMQAFGDPASHGFVRIAAAIPRVRPADPGFNVERTIALAHQAAGEGAALVAFPELGLSAYTSDDLFHQSALTDAVLEALGALIGESTALSPVLVVGAPLVIDQRLFNAAIVIHRGRVLGIVPKSYLPNYREFYEKRQFRAARDAVSADASILGQRAPFGADLIFDCTDVAGLAIGIEICEDLWVPIPPSTYAALAGATVLVNLSASNITVGKADYRRLLCASQSGRNIAAHLYVAAGAGESTTDLAWDGHALIYENGELLAESERFAAEECVLEADVDLDRLAQDRMRTTSMGDCARDHREPLRAIRRIAFELEPRPARTTGPLALHRHLERFPYVPHQQAQREERCHEVYSIQVAGLATRLRATGIERVVIGVSGGLDSTQALLVAARAMDTLGLPRENVLAYTMPGFATSARTLANARSLMETLGVSATELDIRPAAEGMLRDIGHPAGEGAPQYDVTYENVQAGERTSHLFRLANLHDALVVGTGDLSELAVGWCTYGVGDQMSHYAVNASVPKTLIQFLIRWNADTDALEHGASGVLESILDTEISPELIPHTAQPAIAGASGPPANRAAVPGAAGSAGNGSVDDAPAADSESVVGPYELIDFFLYYTLRFGYRPSKVAFLAHSAWGDRDRGGWPDLIPPERRREYALPEIKHWLEVFLVRFFATSQFKRSAIPNAPKVGGSLSPRGDWRAPSDGNAEVWLRELSEHVP